MAEPDPGPAPDPVPPTDPAPPAPPEPDPDAGAKKALDAERKARRDADAAVKRLESELAQLRQSQMTDQEKALETARTEGRQEAETRLTSRLVRAEVRALAAGRTVDPDLVAQLIDPSRLKWDGDDLDRESAEKEIGKIVADKPYLAVPDPSAPPSPTVPRVPAGPRGTPAGSITRADLKRMSPEQIATAYQKGELAHLMAEPT